MKKGYIGQLHLVSPTQIAKIPNVYSTYNKFLNFRTKNYCGIIHSLWKNRFCRHAFSCNCHTNETICANIEIHPTIKAVGISSKLNLVEKLNLVAKRHKLPKIYFQNSNNFPFHAFIGTRKDLILKISIHLYIIYYY